MSSYLEQIPFSAIEFAENPEPRCACVLLLDTSASMDGERIQQLNAGLRILQNDLGSDSLASKRVELAIVTFGPARKHQDWTTASQFSAPTLTASGNTPLGEAIALALDMVAERKQVYKTNGISYYRPWVFLITDGAPTDHWRPVADKVKAEEGRGGLSFYSVGVDGADFDVLRAIGVREPLRLQGLKFQEMFLWLTATLGTYAMSAPGEVVALRDPTSGPKGWAVIDV